MSVIHGVSRTAGDRSEFKKEVKVGGQENFPGGPLLWTVLSWMTSVLSIADLDCDPTYNYMLPD